RLTLHAAISLYLTHTHTHTHTNTQYIYTDTIKCMNMKTFSLIKTYTHTHTFTHTHSHNQCFLYTGCSMRLAFCRCCCLYWFFVRGQVSVVLYPFSPSKLCSMYVPVKFVCLCHINTHLSNKSMYACFAF